MPPVDPHAPHAHDSTHLMIDRAISDDIDDLQHALAATQARLQRLEEALAAERAERARADKALVARLRPMISGMRLDRQVLRAGRHGLGAGRTGVDRARHRITSLAAPVVVVCPSYPGGPKSYGGEFVRARLRRYADHGVHVQVVVTDRSDRTVQTTTMDGIPVHRTHRQEVPSLLRLLRPSLIGVHHMEPGLWSVLKPFAGTVPMVVWVHGYESRDWRDVAFNYSEEYLARHREALEEGNRARRTTTAEVFGSDGVHVVFVSEFMRRSAIAFAGREPRASSVIPNLVDENLFRYRQRRPEERWKILWVRTFASRKYANDVARDAVLRLSRSPDFAKMTITVVGDGALFEECTGPLRQLDNVHITKGFVSPEELAALHDRHGLMLVPTRWDSQGLTCLEAMSSGLVPITSAVTAVPEFVPPQAGALCPAEDADAHADAVLALQKDVDAFLECSRIGAEAVRSTCSTSRTIAVECDLIRRLGPIGLTRRAARRALRRS